MKRKLFFCALAVIALYSCDDTTDGIGTSLIDRLDKLEVSSDTFKVTTRSVIADSVLSRSTTGYLGRIRDPETGNYITSDFMTQFHTFEDYTWPNENMIVSKADDGKVIADSCELRLFYDTYYGDSLAPLRVSVYEMQKPMKESQHVYSNFDPLKEGYVRTNGIAVNKSFTLNNQSLSEETKNSSSYTPNISIKLNEPYTDKEGNHYNNFGTYMMRKYYEDPSNYKNSITFINNVVPGFYVKLTNGLGAMANIYVTQLNVYFRYNYNDSTVTGSSSFSGTEEVLQASHISNDAKRLEELAADNSCTYLKTPAGIFTEVTLPVEEIYNGHEGENINTAKITLQRVNDSKESDYAFGYPSTVLILPADSLYSFFENNDIADNKISYLASYSSTTNGYTFSNISGMIKQMKENHDAGNTSPKWNKAVIVPVTTTYYTSNSVQVLTKVTHDMSLSSTRLVGGSDNKRGDIKLAVIYSKYK